MLFNRGGDTEFHTCVFSGVVDFNVLFDYRYNGGSLCYPCCLTLVLTGVGIGLAVFTLYWIYLLSVEVLHTGQVVDNSTG